MFPETPATANKAGPAATTAAVICAVIGVSVADRAASVREGAAVLGLGVTGTPTFFRDGKLIEPSTLEEFEQLVADAVDD
jgi:protein-disulfide isomerase